MGYRRITSIDALRAITLLGILIVHTSVIFSFLNNTNHFDISHIGYALNRITKLVLQFRCNKIFGILFGVSFYLILRNPNYKLIKYVWRCILLIGIGLVNKIFYTVDALMWYGMWGVVLVLFRRLSCRWLLICFGLTFFISSLCLNTSILQISSNSPPLARYNLPTSLKSIMRYPILSAARDYIVIVSRDPLSCLWQFLLGYYLGKSGIIEKIEQYAKFYNAIILGIGYFIFFVLSRFNLGKGIDGLVLNLSWLLGSLFYSILFLWIYYRFFPILRYLEAYGKLSLTNYSMQGVVGVIISLLLYIPYHWPIEYIYISSLVFFLFQLIFSNVWLQYFTNGPLEWIWRCLTNLKYVSPLKRYDIK